MTDGMVLAALAVVFLAANEWSVRRLPRESRSDKTWLTVRLATIHAAGLSAVCAIVAVGTTVTGSYAAALVSGALCLLGAVLAVRYVRLQSTLTRPDPPGDRLFSGFERPRTRRAVGLTSAVCVALLVMPLLLALVGVPGAARFWAAIGPPALLVALLAVPAYVIGAPRAR